MTKIDQFAFKDVFPEELQNTSLPDFFWTKFNDGDFQKSWEFSFRGYEELDAMKRLIHNFCLLQMQKFVGQQIASTLQINETESLWTQGKIEIPVTHPLATQLLTDVKEQEEIFNKLSAAEKGKLLEAELLRPIMYSSDRTQQKAFTERNITNVGLQFRFRVQESISQKMPFNDYILHDIHGGSPARSPIFTGTAIPFSINNLASTVSNIPKRKKRKLED